MMGLPEESREFFVEHGHFVQGHQGEEQGHYPPAPVKATAPALDRDQGGDKGAEQQQTGREPGGQVHFRVEVDEGDVCPAREKPRVQHHRHPAQQDDGPGNAQDNPENGLDG